LTRFEKLTCPLSAEEAALSLSIVLVLEVQGSMGPVLVRPFRFAGLFWLSPTIQDCQGLKAVEGEDEHEEEDD
jgi:hypothetical protein